MSVGGGVGGFERGILAFRALLGAAWMGRLVFRG